MLQLHLRSQQFYCLLRCTLYWRFDCTHTYRNSRLFKGIVCILIINIFALHSYLEYHVWDTLLAKKVVTPPLKTIKPMWIEILCFHLAEIGMIWTRDCPPTKSDTTLGKHSMQGQVGSSSSETTVLVVFPPNQSSHYDNVESIFAYFFKCFSDCSNNAPSNPYGY